jgi:hypothetical protein
MWEDCSYCWVVLCKNNWFHSRQNLFSKHKIPLAETDVYAPPPALKNSFMVKCDECHKEYLYKSSEVLRHDQELPASFVPHPLFQMEFLPHAVELTEQKPTAVARGADRRRGERMLLDVVLVVRGQTATRKLFQEATFATSVSAFGALVVLSAKVDLGQTIYLKNPKTQKEMECRVTRFGPLYGTQAQVGVEFAQPTLTFWPAVFAPKNWEPVAPRPRAVA